MKRNNTEKTSKKKKKEKGEKLIKETKDYSPQKKGKALFKKRDEKR